ncbi:MAG: M23 family metallopeptidase [Planctomycetes bacterium]|nr:M23 family metallopeptidase [Planctomycetota bacterium]
MYRGKTDKNMVNDSFSVQVYPSGQIYTAKENRIIGGDTFYLRTVVIRNDSGEAISIIDVKIYLLSSGVARVTNEISGKVLETMLQESFDGIKQYSGFCRGFTDVNTALSVIKLEYGVLFKEQDIQTLSNTANLPPGKIAVLHGIRGDIPSEFNIDYLDVEITAKDSKGKLIIKRIGLPLVKYRCKTKLTFPFKGVWQAQTPHRFGPVPTECAVDFVQIDKEGNLSPNQSSELNNYYAFGKPILAPADGVIGDCFDDMADNPIYTDRMPTPEELDYAALFKKYGLKTVGGNYIIIDHNNGEYSCIGHLKHKSLKVKKGDCVRQGQTVAECGNSGESPMPHIHYQLMDKGDFSNARGLPAIFEGRILFRPDKGAVLPRDGQYCIND